MFYIFILILIINSVKCQLTIDRQTIQMCADYYKLKSYSLECNSGQAVNIINAVQKFERQNSDFPDCSANGALNYNYSKPFIDYCNGKMICIISAAFLNQEKLFNAETYFLPDNSFYLIPYRIDVTYDCSRKTLPTTTIRTTEIDTTSETSVRVTTISPTTSTSTSTRIQITVITDVSTSSTNILTTTSTTTTTTTIVSTTISAITNSSSSLNTYINNNTSISSMPNTRTPISQTNPTTQPITTTRLDNYVINSNTDRTVMIVLIVLGCVFFLIILAIIVLICIRRRNQKNLDREFGYKAETGDTFSRRGSGGVSNIAAIVGSIREKNYAGPFSEISNTTAVRNFENSTETYGTYRSRDNIAYDTMDKSNIFNNRPKIDQEEYWRTNI